VLGLVALALAGLFALPAHARTLPAVAPVAACEALAATVYRAGDAPVRVAEAKTVTGEPAGTYCRVTGYVAPQVHFELRLPANGWHQRLLFTGCGGFCGQVSIRVPAAEGCAPVTNGEIALVASDLGHSAAGQDTVWANGNPQGIRDYGHRGVHVVTLAAKAIIQAYYGQAPAFSYFSGCSDGGREGMMEAQRYPGDFDGIVAGAAVIDDTINNSIYHAWIVQHLLAPDGSPRFSDTTMAAVADDVLRQCDARDGVKDGVLADPERCIVSLGKLACSDAGASPACLSADQVATLEALYTGPVDATGRRLYHGLPPGSERSWNQWSKGSLLYATNFVTHMTGQTFSGETDVWKLGFAPQNLAVFNRNASEINAADPDLAAFSGRGGKLIMWHGWTDAGVPPGSSTGYFAAVRGRLGAKAQDAFMRLYMLPGVNHCGGGGGPDKLDLLTPLMAWVEDGVAPGAVTAYSRTEGEGRTWTIRPYPALPTAPTAR
ncbi:MAG: tannase/feruloyl esterase family alpha/beta hydrolase, partial [Sphingomonadales bacterium]